MVVVPNPGAPAFFELKGAALTLVALVLKTTDLGALAAELDAQTAGTPDLFDRDPVVLDLTPVRDTTEPIDFVALSRLLHRYKMISVAVKGGSPAQMSAAFEVGLVAAHDSLAPITPRQRHVPATPAPPSGGAHVPTAPTMIVARPLRSGQQVYARGGDLVVLGVVSDGAEVLADGHIHVYAPLRGRAVAGARGDTRARIFTTCMQAQLISIAGTYRTTDTPLPAEVLGKAAQARLDGDRLVVEPLKV